MKKLITVLTAIILLTSCGISETPEAIITSTSTTTAAFETSIAAETSSYTITATSESTTASATETVPSVTAIIETTIESTITEPRVFDPDRPYNVSELVENFSDEQLSNIKKLHIMLSGDEYYSDVFEKIKDVEELIISPMTYKDSEPTFDFLYHFKNLKVLHVDGHDYYNVNMPFDLKYIVQNKDLKTLSLNEMTIRGLYRLTDFSELEELSIYIDSYYDDYAEFDVFYELPGLKILHIDWLGEDLEFLPTLTSIEELHICNVYSMNIPDLSRLTNLRHLWLSRCEFDDYSFLYTLPDLECFEYYEFIIPEEHINAFKESHPNCEIRHGIT